jgi:hypothetical protein
VPCLGGATTSAVARRRRRAAVGRTRAAHKRVQGHGTPSPADGRHSRGNFNACEPPKDRREDFVGQVYLRFRRHTLRRRPEREKDANKEHLVGFAPFEKTFSVVGLVLRTPRHDWAAARSSLLPISFHCKRTCLFSFVFLVCLLQKAAHAVPKGRAQQWLLSACAWKTAPKIKKIARLCWRVAQRAPSPKSPVVPAPSRLTVWGHKEGPQMLIKKKQKSV